MIRDSDANQKKPVMKVKGRQIVGSQEIKDENNSDDDDESRGLGSESPSSDDDAVVRDREQSPIDSVAERAKASQLTLKTDKSAEPEPDIGDQKVLDQDSGPLYKQKVDVDDKVFLARIAEVGQRPEDMVEYIVEMMRMKDQQQVQLKEFGERQKPVPADYTKAERNLVHVGFKTVLGPKRVAVRTISAILENPKYNRYSKKIAAYKQKLQQEIISDCTYYLDMLQSYCIDRKGNRIESETFFNLMAADLTRYICE